MKKNGFIFFVLCLLAHVASAQTTVFFQGFENASLTCAENWGYTGGVRNSENNRTGSFAARVGRLSESNTLTFNTVNVAGLTGMNLQVFHSVRGGTGPGMDTREGAVIMISLNGAAYVPIGSVGGFGDVSWAYSATGGSASASSGCTVYQCTNPLNYSIPNGTTTVALKVVSVTGSSCSSFNTNMSAGTGSSFDRNDEGFFIDDVKLTTTGTAIPGIWTGLVSTDWFDCNNWHNRIVPTANTAVTIDQTAVNNCVVASAGAVCASIALSSNNTTVNSLTVQNSGSLVVGGNVTVTKTGSNANLKLTLLNSATFTCQNLTLTGTASGQENAQFENEMSTSVLATINGDLTINNGGKLDLTNSGNYGILHIHGNYVNNGLETDFKQTDSYVYFDGSGAQNINTNNFNEVFSNVVVNKSSGALTLLDNIDVEEQLNLQAGPLDLGGKTVTIYPGGISGIVRTSGYAISENTSNASKITWQMGSTTGPHVFPFGRSSGYYLPFTFHLTAGNAGNVTVSTYHTAADNTPYPVTPNSVNDVNDLLGNDNSANVVDRFWQIDKTGASGTATLTFTYDDAEVPSNGEANMVAQRYADNPTEAWQVPLTGQTANSTANTVTVPGVTTFSPWTLSSNLIVLPAELIDFSGLWLSDKNVLLSWEVAEENNVSYYSVQKSTDGKHFADWKTIQAHGTGSKTYELNDEDAAAISYYGLYSVDKNGKRRYCSTIVMERPETVQTIIDTRDALYILHCAACHAEILDLNGKQVQIAPADGSAYAKQSLEPGIYFLRLYDGEKIVVRRFVVL